jgi:hypothetical protein
MEEAFQPQRRGGFMSLQRRAPVAAVLVLTALAGCNWTNGPDYRDRLSTVSDVATPDSVANGAAFTVDVTTWGPDGCWRQGHDSVSRPNLLLARIVPFDREYTGTGACTANIVVFHHVVPITATARGDLEIEVRTRLRAVSGKDSAGVILKLVHVH